MSPADLAWLGPLRDAWELGTGLATLIASAGLWRLITRVRRRQVDRFKVLLAAETAERQRLLAIETAERARMLAEQDDKRHKLRGELHALFQALEARTRELRDDVAAMRVEVSADIRNLMACVMRPGAD